MGLAMARNLSAAGFPLRVWNRTPRATGLPAEVSVWTSPREAARDVEIAVTMLAEDTAVESVALGPGGVLEGLKQGGIHLGMSTISVELSRRLAAAHSQVGQCYVAAPVFGRPEAAEQAKLWILPGGTLEDVTRCAPLFTAMGQGTFPMPDAPRANLAKLIGNFLIAVTIEGVGEALALGERGGIAPARLFEMLAATLFGSPVFKGYGQRIVDAAYRPAGFTMPLGLKDVNLVLAAATGLGVPLPLGELARDRLAKALERGRADFDWAGFATVIREESGLPAL
jgi:3-hydroxyisobutyrate dehydrogenase-like beta-hydroxyacid dehydrogenase